MGNICGAAPSKDNQDQPIDHKSKQIKSVSTTIRFSDSIWFRICMTMDQLDNYQ